MLFFGFFYNPSQLRVGPGTLLMFSVLFPTPLLPTFGSCLIVGSSVTAWIDLTHLSSVSQASKLLLEGFLRHVLMTTIEKQKRRQNT